MSHDHEDERVLSTLNADGSRHLIRPKLAPGRFLTRRQIVGYALIVLFATLPFVKIGGKPALMINLIARELNVFGMTFRPSDGFLLMLLGLSIVWTVFLVTALFGRIWCGWGCPQLVYMEHVFRPLERWIEGGDQQIRTNDAGGKPPLRRIIKWFVFVLIAFVLANIFLSYFVGMAQLQKWVLHSPAAHPLGFGVVMFVTALVFFDFAYFREQTCIIACPYGRLQSVLVDQHSLIVAYDAARGEPRGKAKKKLPVAADEPKTGDCIDCYACVNTCPTGIDIRRGLQMECVGCAQCIDACDTIMTKIGRPTGLVRYTAKAILDGKSSSILRPRVFIYPALLTIALAFLFTRLDARDGTEVWVERIQGAPFMMMADGTVKAQLRLRMENKSDNERTYRFAVENAPDVVLSSAMPEWKIGPHKMQQVPLLFDANVNAFAKGERKIKLLVTDNEGHVTQLAATLFGPEGPAQ